MDNPVWSSIILGTYLSQTKCFISGFSELSKILLILESELFEPSLVEFDNEKEVKTLFDDGRFFCLILEKNDFRNVPNILEYLLWNILELKYSNVEHFEHHQYHSITRISKYINID